MKKVAILAFHFKPEQVVGAIRPENWANWLASEYEVVVITRHDCNDFNKCNDYKLVPAKSAVIHMIERLNEWRLSRKRASASKANGQSNQRISRRTSGIITYRMPCLYDFWFLACYRALQAQKPDMVIATHSPYISLLVGLIYKVSNPRTKLWLDFRDLWTTGHITKGMWPFSLLERRLEDSALKSADVITTVSEGLKMDIRKRSEQKKGDLIYNAPAATSTSDCNGAAKVKNDCMVICYTGTGYAGWRDPSPLFSLLADLHSSGAITNADVKFTLASRNPGDILELAARFGIMGYVDFRGSVSRDEAINIQENSDILMLMESNDSKANGVLTGKVFEYLSTSKPILLLGPGPEAELYNLLRKHDRIITIEQVKAVLTGQAETQTMDSVNYAAIARTQLLDIARRCWL